MAKKQVSSVNVTFVSPVTSITDKSEIKAAYKDLCKQITSLAESIAADPNVIISHSSLSGPGITPVEIVPVDTKIAELQAVGKRVATGKSVAVVPGYKSKFDSDATDEEEVKDPEERPRVKICDWVKTSEPVEKVQEKPTHWEPPQAKTEVAKPVDTALKGKMEVTIFSKLRKTENSQKIVGYFLSNMDKEVSIDDIAAGTKLEKGIVTSWLAQTGKGLKAISSGEKRGHYIFDSSKVKVY